MDRVKIRGYSTKTHADSSAAGPANDSLASSPNHSLVPDESAPEDDSKAFAVATEAEISEIALAPLLAIVVWLLLSQGQTTANIYWLAAVSFSIGLITKEIIESIKKLMTRLTFDTTDHSRHSTE
jgi:hypothetical protein